MKAVVKKTKDLFFVLFVLVLVVFVVVFFFCCFFFLKISFPCRVVGLIKTDPEYNK